MSNDLSKVLHKVQKMPRDRRELAFDLLKLLDAVETPWTEKEKQERKEQYAQLLATDRVRKPINKDEAETLVRCHPAMPSPFPEHQLDPKATFKRHPRTGIIIHSPLVIQEYFQHAFSDILRQSYAVHALRSVEMFEQIKVWAETSPLSFDGLQEAATLTIHPSISRFPTTEHLRRWKYDVERERIKRPTGKTGAHPLMDVTRNVFFCDVVEDLRSCGLYARKTKKKPKKDEYKDEAIVERRVYACCVVADVYGTTMDTVWKACMKIKKVRKRGHVTP